MFINIITKLSIFKISAALMLSTLGLMMYNREAFLKYMGNTGILIFVISISIMCIYIFITMYYYKSINIEPKINISTYFALSGIAYILSSLWKFFNNTFEFSNIEGDFLILNIGYLLFGSLIIYKDKIYNEKKSTIWKNASILAPFITLILQLYIENIQYYSDIILENPIVNSVKQVLLSGPSV